MNRKVLFLNLAKNNHFSFSFTDDGICMACKMPANYVTIVENYCLADFGKVIVLLQSLSLSETRCDPLVRALCADLFPS